MGNRCGPTRRPLHESRCTSLCDTGHRPRLLKKQAGTWGTIGPRDSGGAGRARPRPWPPGPPPRPPSGARARPPSARPRRARPLHRVEQPAQRRCGVEWFMPRTVARGHARGCVHGRSAVPCVSAGGAQRPTGLGGATRRVGRALSAPYRAPQARSGPKTTQWLSQQVPFVETLWAGSPVGPPEPPYAPLRPRPRVPPAEKCVVAERPPRAPGRRRRPSGPPLRSPPPARPLPLPSPAPGRRRAGHRAPVGRAQPRRARGASSLLPRPRRSVPSP
jgi:hypothetical protein